MSCSPLLGVVKSGDHEARASFGASWRVERHQEGRGVARDVPRCPELAEGSRVQWRFLLPQKRGLNVFRVLHFSEFVRQWSYRCM